MAGFIHYMSPLFRDDRLSKLDVEIMYRLRGCSYGYIQDQQTLCDWTGKSKSGISRAINRLERLGYVERIGKRIVAAQQLKVDAKQLKVDAQQLFDEETILLKENKKDAGASLTRSFIAEHFPKYGVPLAVQAAKEWVAYRKQARFKAWTLNTWAKNLADFDGDSERFFNAVEHSIKRGYQGLFEPKSHNQPPQTEYDKAIASGVFD